MLKSVPGQQLRGTRPSHRPPQLAAGSNCAPRLSPGPATAQESREGPTPCSRHLGALGSRPRVTNHQCKLVCFGPHVLEENLVAHIPSTFSREVQTLPSPENSRDLATVTTFTRVSQRLSHPACTEVSTPWVPCQGQGTVLLQLPRPAPEGGARHQRPLPCAQPPGPVPRAHRSPALAAPTQPTPEPSVRPGPGRPGPGLPSETPHLPTRGTSRAPA